MGTFREQFIRTSETLARHQASIHERFIDALNAGVTHLSSDERELEKMPAELRESFLEFMEKVTKLGGSRVPGKGSVHGTISEMSVGEVQMLVDEFLALNSEVRNTPR